MSSSDDGKQIGSRQPLSFGSCGRVRQQEKSYDLDIRDKLEAGIVVSLKAIYNYLFNEIYDFAGELRSDNITRGAFRADDVFVGGTEKITERC